MEEFNKIKNNILYTALKLDSDNYNKLFEHVKKVLEDNYNKDNVELVNKDLYKELKLDNIKSKNIIKVNNNYYKVNDEFHVTCLFANTKEMKDKYFDFYERINSKIELTINNIGVTDEFICCSVSFDKDLPYYGNEVKHITFGLNSFKKLQPKNSFNALVNNTNMYKTDFKVEAELKYITK